MNKKIKIIVLAFTILISFAGIAYSISNSIFLKDMIVENGLYQTNPPIVNANDAKSLSNININCLENISDDGSFIFEVRDNKNNEMIGKYYYKPWLEKKPINHELPNGDVILGKNKLFNNQDKKIYPLSLDDKIVVFDYSVNNNKIAYIGKNNGRINIYIRNLGDNKVEIVDSYQYPEFYNAENVFLEWGKEDLLFYDYCQNEKPLVKVYDMKNGQKEIFMECAMNPQISPDGKFMVIESMTGFDKNERQTTELNIIGISNKSHVSKLNGSNHLFWVSDYIINWNVDNSTLEVHDLNNNGVKIKDISVEGLPTEIKTENTHLKIKTYKFINNTFTINNDDVNL